MTNHPLTDEICEEVAEDVFYYDFSIPTFRFDMRSAADWQLEQVMKWLDERLTDYSDTEVWACIDNLYRLKNDLKKAMRPTTQEDDNA